jgi:hypothetical protein
VCSNADAAGKVLSQLKQARHLQPGGYSRGTHGAATRSAWVGAPGPPHRWPTRTDVRCAAHMARSSVVPAEPGSASPGRKRWACWRELAHKLIRASARTSIAPLQVCIRPTFSSPPVHGARIVAKTVHSPALFAAWRIELKVCACACACIVAISADAFHSQSVMLPPTGSPEHLWSFRPPRQADAPPADGLTRSDVRFNGACGAAGHVRPHPCNACAAPCRAPAHRVSRQSPAVACARTDAHARHAHQIAGTAQPGPTCPKHEPKHQHACANMPSHRHAPYSPRSPALSSAPCWECMALCLFIADLRYRFAQAIGRT